MLQSDIPNNSQKLDKYVGEVTPAPKNVPLSIPSLPKLKPIGEQKPQELPKINLKTV